MPRLLVFGGQFWYNNSHDDTARVRECVPAASARLNEVFRRYGDDRWRLRALYSRTRFGCARCTRGGSGARATRGAGRFAHCRGGTRPRGDIYETLADLRPPEGGYARCRDGAFDEPECAGDSLTHTLGQFGTLCA